GLALAPQEGTGSIATAASGTSASQDTTSPPRALSTNAPEPVQTSPSPCGEGMVLIEGDYCPDAEQLCVKWLDPPPYQNLRCGEYAKPAKCKVSRVHRRFCIDREEFAELNASDHLAGGSIPSGSAAPSPGVMPLVNKNWGEAKALCEA